MRILFFTVCFEAESNEWHNYADEVAYVIKNFPQTQFIVYMISSNFNRSFLYSEGILKVERKNLKNIRTAFQFFKDMIKIFTKFKPDIIHSVYVIESIIIGIFGKLFRVPSILHGRGMDINYFPFKSLKSYFLAKIGCLLNNSIITVSKAMGINILRLKVPKKKIFPIYDGLDFSEFTPQQNKVYLRNNKLELIHVSRLSLEKCQNLIIEVCKKLRDNQINFHCTIIGEGPLKRILEALILKYNLTDFITMTGLIEHNRIPKFLENADLYLQPSLSEGMPKSVYEAMSMELCIVMTKVGGMNELNVKPGVILIDKNNKNQLYNAIVTFINNPEKIVAGGKKNRAFILNNFNWNIHAKKLYDIYTNLIQNNKKKN